MIAPSGEQTTIALGDQQAVIVEVGGGLRSYSAGGRQVVDGYSPNEMRYEFDGKLHQLPLNEPERRNAIHGLVRWTAWSVAEREPHRVVMQHVLHPQPGYPFLLRTSIEYELSDRGLRVRTITTNLGSERCPFGRGAHPYLTLGTATINRLFLTLPAETVLQSDQRGLPIDSKAVDGLAPTILDSHSQSALQYSTMHLPTFNETRTESLA